MDRFHEAVVFCFYTGIESQLPQDFWGQRILMIDLLKYPTEATWSFENATQLALFQDFTQPQDLPKYSLVLVLLICFLQSVFFFTTNKHFAALRLLPYTAVNRISPLSSLPIGADRPPSASVGERQCETTRRKIMRKHGPSARALWQNLHRVTTDYGDGLQHRGWKVLCVSGPMGGARESLNEASDIFTHAEASVRISGYQTAACDQPRLTAGRALVTRDSNGGRLRKLGGRFSKQKTFLLP